MGVLNVQRCKDLNNSIYYIIDHKFKILAFCVISIDNKYKIIDIKLLCSNKEKQNINGNSLGKYLLNFIYSEYIDKYIIKILPATNKLIDYYESWKIPDFPYRGEDTDTFGYLLYGDLKSCSDETLKKLFSSLNLIDSLKQYLKLNTINNSINSINSLKKKFKNKLQQPTIKNLYSSNHYIQIYNLIDGIKYISVNDIKNKYLNYKNKITENKKSI